MFNGKQNKSRIRDIAVAINNARYFKSQDMKPDYMLVCTSLELEGNVNSYIKYDLYTLGKARSYLDRINAFKMNRIWGMETMIDYERRLKQDAYLFYCLKGMETEKQITGNNHVMEFLKGDEPKGLEEVEEIWDIIRPVFYEVYERIGKYIQYIPAEFDELLSETLITFKTTQVGGGYLNIECLLFLYGFFSDLIEMINEEELIDKVIISESGEMRIAPF